MHSGAKKTPHASYCDQAMFNFHYLCQNVPRLEDRPLRFLFTGFTLYTNKGARLERALINFMLDVQTEENGYIEISPPLFVNKRSAQTTGQLPKFSEDMYYIDTDELHCIPTAEVPVTNIHFNEIIDEN